MKLTITFRASLLKTVSNFLAEEGIKSYLVGGFVRDLLLGRDNADIDLAVSGNALEVAARVADLVGGRFVPLDEVNGVGRVVLTGEETPAGQRYNIDFSTLKGVIERDLAQRDFTINAMAVDLGKALFRPATVPGDEQMEARLIDPFAGRADIRQGVVCAVSEDVFKSDPVRLLRAVRLAAELGFAIHEDTEDLIRRGSTLVKEVAGERVREELLRLLAMPGAGEAIMSLDSLGLLTVLIPELAPEKGFQQPKEHVWDVFRHSVQAVVAVEFVLRQSHAWDYASVAATPVPWSESLSRHFLSEISSGGTRASLVKFGALVHDIAKPQTRTVMENGRVRFLGHAVEGAKIVASLMERLRFSNREIQAVGTLVEHHLRPTQMRSDGPPTRRAIYRFFRDTGDTGIDVLFLSLADHLATRGPNLDKEEWRKHVDTVSLALEQRFQEETPQAPARLLDGHDLMTMFGLQPGPGLGRLLEDLNEAQASGEISSREEALAYIRKRLASEGIVNSNAEKK